MAIVASLLRSEMRRHLMMNVGLVASCVVAGTVVTNERGLFVPLTHGFSAFAAMFTQSHFLPDERDLTDVRMVSPLAAFEVTADSRDLRRRLMDAFGDFSGASPLASLDPTTLTPTSTQLSSNEIQNGGFAPGGGQKSETASNTVLNSGNGNGTGTGTGNGTGTGTDNNNLNNINNGINVNSTPVVPASFTADDTGAVPEPSSWAMLIAGFGLVGYFLRNARRRGAQGVAEKAA